jgi:hypothetical protein
MRSRGTTLVLAGALGLAGLTGGLVVGPAIAVAATSEESAADAVGNRVERLKEALQGLVDDGTLTTEQRDKVAETLDSAMPNGRGHGPGHPGRGLGHLGKHLALDVAASTLGMTEAELLTELREGRSLADVAEEKGVSLETLKSELQKAAEERLAQAVEDGRLTQEEADEKKAELAERIADAVEREGLPGRGHGHGWGPGGKPS